VLIEIQNKDSLAIHHDVAEAVDQMLRGYIPSTEVRERALDGGLTIRQPQKPAMVSLQGRQEQTERREGSKGKKQKMLRIYPYALSRERLERAIHGMGSPAVITNDLDEADVLLTLKSHAKRQSHKLREARGRNVEVRVVRSNTLTQMENFLRETFGSSAAGGSEDLAMQEVEDGVMEALENRRPVELSPQPKHIRRMQHIYIERSGMQSESKGQEPMRRIIIYPHR